jgi:hypothetical protein
MPSLSELREYDGKLFHLHMDFRPIVAALKINTFNPNVGASS